MAPLLQQIGESTNELHCQQQVERNLEPQENIWRQYCIFIENPFFFAKTMPILYTPMYMRLYSLLTDNIRREHENLVTAQEVEDIILGKPR